VRRNAGRAFLVLALLPLLALPKVRHFEIELDPGVERSEVRQEGNYRQIRSWREGRRAIPFGPFILASGLFLALAMLCFPGWPLQWRLSGCTLSLGLLVAGAYVSRGSDSSFFGDFRAVGLELIAAWVALHLAITWSALPLLKARIGMLHLALYLLVIAAFAVLRFV
jgi:hypothetical protein